MLTELKLYCFYSFGIIFFKSLGTLALLSLQHLSLTLSVKARADPIYFSVFDFSNKSGLLFYYFMSGDGSLKGFRSSLSSRKLSSTYELSSFD